MIRDIALDFLIQGWDADTNFLPYFFCFVWWSYPFLLKDLYTVKLLNKIVKFLRKYELRFIIFYLYLFRPLDHQRKNTICWLMVGLSTNAISIEELHLSLSVRWTGPWDTYLQTGPLGNIEPNNLKLSWVKHSSAGIELLWAAVNWLD